MNDLNVTCDDSTHTHSSLGEARQCAQAPAAVVRCFCPDYTVAHDLPRGNGNAMHARGTTGCAFESYRDSDRVAVAGLQS